MSARILLNVSARRVTFALYRRGRLSGLVSRPNDEGAREAFAGLVAAHPGCPVYMMVDVVEEDFRSEQLPHVLGRARREMVARRLAQCFRAFPYRAACLQGRVNGRRRDDQYLFMALTASEFLAPYIAVAAARNTPLAGIWLLPVVSGQLVRRLSRGGNVLLVSRQGGGLRQSLFVDGHLRISRLTPVEDVPEGDLAAVLAEEMEKSRLFFYNSRVLSRDASLEALVLDPDGSLAAACERVGREPGFRCRALDTTALSRLLDPRARALLPDMDVVMLYLLGRQPSRCNLAPPDLNRGFLLHRVRHGMAGLAVGVLVVAAGVGAYNVLERHLALKEAQRLAERAAQIRARYEETTRRFPAAPASAEHMRRTVEAVEQLRSARRTPAEAFRLMGRVLADHPQVELERLAWRAGGTAGSAPFPPGREVVELAAEIRPFDGDYRTALGLIGRLRDALREMPGVAEVRITRLPVDLDPATPLAGNTTDTPETAPARFELFVLLEGRS